MGNDRRVRRLVVNEAVWCWTVRRRVRPDYGDCQLTLSLFPQVSAQGAERRLTLVFAPGANRIVSNSYFEAGTMVRLPDPTWLNLAPGSVSSDTEAGPFATQVGPASRTHSSRAPAQLASVASPVDGAADFGHAAPNHLSRQRSQTSISAYPGAERRRAPRCNGGAA